MELDCEAASKKASSYSAPNCPGDFVARNIPPVFINTTPLAPRAPYIAVAWESFRIWIPFIRSVSSSLIFPVKTIPSITYSGSPLKFVVPLPLIWIETTLSGTSDLVISTPATLPAKVPVRADSIPPGIPAVLTTETDPVNELFSRTP